MEHLLVRILINAMRNETHVEIIRDLIDLVKRVGAGSIGVTALLAELERVYGIELTLFEVITKSEWTAKIEEMDKTRDDLFHGFVDALAAFARHPVAAKREAAASLVITAQHYRDIARKSYDDETANLDDFTRELKTAENQARLATVALTEWSDRIEATNLAFVGLMHSRDQEAEKRPKESMKEARAEVDKVVHALLARVEAQITLYGLTSTSSDYRPFVDAWNTLAERYKHRLAIERGRRLANREKEEI
jgi:hypothetical protein